MEDVFLPIMICGMLFIGLPWLIFHYVTQWKRNRGLSVEDENLMDELYDLARRLSERLETIERIVAADNPNFRPGLARPDPTAASLADQRRVEREDDLLADPRRRFERR